MGRDTNASKTHVRQKKNLTVAEKKVSVSELEANRDDRIKDEDKGELSLKVDFRMDIFKALLP